MTHPHGVDLGGVDEREQPLDRRVAGIDDEPEAVVLDEEAIASLMRGRICPGTAQHRHLHGPNLEGDVPSRVTESRFAEVRPGTRSGREARERDRPRHRAADAAERRRP